MLVYLSDKTDVNFGTEIKQTNIYTKIEFCMKREGPSNGL
jgi:hypothetical protein